MQQAYAGLSAYQTEKILYPGIELAAGLPS